MRRVLMLFMLVTLLVTPARTRAADQVKQLASPPATPAIFAGLSDGRVFSSGDGGATWRESDRGMAGGAVYPLIAGAGRTIYAAPGVEGIYKSVDGGRTWHDGNGVGGPSGLAVFGLAVDPGDGRRVDAVDENGVFYHSLDGGATWQRSQAPLDQFQNSSADAIQVDPLRPNTLLLTSATGMAISLDGGYTWRMAAGIPPGVDVFAAAFSGADPDVAYAATADGIYQTIDGGWNWEREARGMPGGAAPTVVAVDPLDASLVVAYTEQGGLYRSTDGGTSWREVAAAGNGLARSLAFDPGHPGTVLAGSVDGALYVSRDGGAHWRFAGLPFGSAVEIDSLATAVRGPLPTDPVAPPVAPAPGITYVTQTQHTIAGPFLTFYNRHGGLRIFGLPLTEAFVERGHAVQFFERAEMIAYPGWISLAHLGDLLTGRRFPPAQPSTSCDYEVPTRHNLCAPFWSFWDAHDGPLVFGLPISEPRRERNGDGTGRTYLVQYFKNARLEYHPELAGTSYEVSVGLLGREALERRGWL